MQRPAGKAIVHLKRIRWQSRLALTVAGAMAVMAPLVVSPGTPAGASPSPATASTVDWSQAVLSTAGFACAFGFTNVPGGCETQSATSARTAAAAGLGVPSVLIGIARLGVSVYSAISHKQQLTSISGQLSTISGQLTVITNQLTTLSTEVAEADNLLQNTELSELADDLTPDTIMISQAGKDTKSLLAYAYQIACYDAGGTPSGGHCSGGNPSAVGLASARSLCNGAGQTTPQFQACNNLRNEYNNLKNLQVLKNLPLAVTQITEDALGQAGGGPPGPGIVQYASAPPVGIQILTTASMATARINWGYYAYYAMYAQALYATLLSLGAGQTQPGTNPPVVLTPEVIGDDVNPFDTDIDYFMGAFPNFPDTAAIDLNSANGITGDPAYMWSQQVGALNNIGPGSAYSANTQWDITPNAQDQVNGATGQYMQATPDSGEAPFVMTPAAADGDTWRLLAGGSSFPPTVTVPSMSYQYWDTWQVGTATLSGSTPDWNSSAEEVYTSLFQVTGPLGDLFIGGPSDYLGGQQMTALTGINSDLLYPNGTGYSGENSSNSNTWGGVQFQTYLGGKKDKTTSIWDKACDAATNSYDGQACLLPTWLSVSINPLTTYNSSDPKTRVIPGIFDYNNGEIVLNQKGVSSGNTTSANDWDNGFPSWNTTTDDECFAVQTLDAAPPSSCVNGFSNSAAWNALGRPILFWRTMDSQDCFFYSAAPDATPGCTAVRTESSQILPPAPTY